MRHTFQQPTNYTQMCVVASSDQIILMWTQHEEFHSRGLEVVMIDSILLALYSINIQKNCEKTIFDIYFSDLHID